jgi:hypothetical protein
MQSEQGNEKEKRKRKAQPPLLAHHFFLLLGNKTPIDGIPVTLSLPLLGVPLSASCRQLTNRCECVETHHSSTMSAKLPFHASELRRKFPEAEKYELVEMIVGLLER